MSVPAASNRGSECLQIFIIFGECLPTHQGCFAPCQAHISPPDIPRFGDVRPWLHRLALAAREGTIVIKDVAILAEPVPPLVGEGFHEWVDPTQTSCAATRVWNSKKGDGPTGDFIGKSTNPGPQDLRHAACKLLKLKARQELLPVP